MAEPIILETAVKTAHEAYQTTMQETGNPAAALEAAQNSMQQSGAQNNIDPIEVEGLISSPEFQNVMQTPAEDLANMDFNNFGPQDAGQAPMGEPAPAGDIPGFIPFNETGEAVFQETIDMGATPEQAFDAATNAMTELAMEYGMPEGGWEADLTAAQESFDSATSAGTDPAQAFSDSREAGGEAAAEWADGNDVPPAPDNSWSGDPEPFAPIEATGEAVFEVGMDMQLPPEQAFDSATSAMQTTGEAMQLPPECVEQYIEGTQTVFNESMEAGNEPIDSFYAGVAAGSEAAHDYALDNPDAMPPEFPPMEHHQDGIELAALEAFDEAVASGATPEATFEAVANAVQEAGAEQGIPQDVIQTGLEAAESAFNEAQASGEDLEGSMEAAMQEGADTANAYEAEHYPPEGGEPQHMEGQDLPPMDDAHMPPPTGDEGSPDVFAQMQEGYGDDMANADGALAEHAGDMGDSATQAAHADDGSVPPMDGAEHVDMEQGANEPAPVDVV